MIENKAVIAANIRRYMEIKDVNSAEVCKALGFKQNTFSNWINGKIYPRIDKIEKLANYFNISKAELVEPYPEIITTTMIGIPPHLKYYLNMLRELSPEAQNRVFDYIEFEKSKEERKNAQS